MNDDDSNHEKTMMMLDFVFQRISSMEETLEGILHAVCKSNDDKTYEAIRKFLISDFRNRRKG